MRQRAGSAWTASRAAVVPAMAGAATRLSTRGREAISATRTYFTQTLLPGLRRTRRWLARRLHPASLMRDYRRLLLLLHRLGPDRSVEQYCFVNTGKHIPLAVVRMPHQLRRSGHDYRPTPRLVFEWAMEALPEPVDRFQFVDYGAGQGRVLVMASHHPFEKITGAEVGQELYEDSLLNVAQYPRPMMKCRDVNCEHVTAMRLPLPRQDTVFYFNNPFNRAMLERAFGRIVEAYKDQPYRYYVICVDIADDELFEDTGIFHKIPMPWDLRLKTALFSPYSIAVYRSVH